VRDVQRDLPTEKELVALVTEFWFKVYHVAKYPKETAQWLGFTCPQDLDRDITRFTEGLEPPDL
jgi:hypothetical protein